MAGTRYYIQGIVLLQVIALVAISLFYGFCIRTNYDDDLCFVLRHRGGSGSDTSSNKGTLELLPPPSLVIFNDNNNNNDNDPDVSTCTSTTTISNQRITIPVSTIEEAKIWTEAVVASESGKGEIGSCPSSLSSSSAGRLTFDFVFESDNATKLMKVCNYHDPRTNDRSQDQDDADEATTVTKERSLWFCPPMTDSSATSAVAAHVVLYRQSMILYPTTTSSVEGNQLILSNLMKLPPQAVSLSPSTTLFKLQLVMEVDIESKSSKQPKNKSTTATRYWTHAISAWKRTHYDQYFVQELNWPISTLSNSVTFHHRIKFVPATSTKLLVQNYEVALQEKMEAEEEKQRLSGNANEDENDDNATTTSDIENEVESSVVGTADVDQVVDVKPKPFTTEQIQQILLQATTTAEGGWGSYDDDEAQSPAIDISIYIPYELPLPLEVSAEKGNEDRAAVPTVTSWMINPRHVATLVTGIDSRDGDSDDDSLKDESYYYRAIETAMNNVGLEELLLHDIMKFDWLVLSKDSKSQQKTPSSSSSSWFLVDSWDGSFPQWYSQLVYREKIVNLLQLVSTELQQSYNLINRHDGFVVESNDNDIVNMTVKTEANEGTDGDFLSSILNLFSSTEATASSHSVRPMDATTRKTVFQLYNDARELYELAVAAAGTAMTPVPLRETINDSHSMTDVDTIVIRLEESLRKVKSIPMFIPLKKHFPWEHYMAMFAPLLFPLFLPFVISLIRERKRYKTKIKEKNEKEASQ